MKAWVIQKEGFLGDLSACIGVARYLDSHPYIILNRQLDLYDSVPQFLDNNTDLQEPDLLIASFQFSTHHMLAIQRCFNKKPLLVNLRDPGFGYDNFSIIAVPEHAAKLEHPNVIKTLGIAHNIRKNELETFKKFAPALLGEKKALVLLGGNCIQIEGESGGGVFSTQSAEKIADQINSLALRHNYSLYISNSHRTPDLSWSAFCSKIKIKNIFSYNFKSKLPNPYLSILGASNIIIVTADSMSMCCEACSTGKPVYLAGLNDTFTRSDHRRLADQLIAEGYAKPLEDFDPTWVPKDRPLDVAKLIADRAVDLLAQRPQLLDVHHTPRSRAANIAI